MCAFVQNSIRIRDHGNLTQSYQSVASSAEEGVATMNRYRSLVSLEIALIRFARREEKTLCIFNLRFDSRNKVKRNSIRSQLYG